MKKRAAQTAGQGSPLYMAPEIIFDKYDARVDVFSLGVTLYELLVAFSDDYEETVNTQIVKMFRDIRQHAS